MFADTRKHWLRDETGTRIKQSSRRLALVYPSPYHVGMSSLGFQSLYRIVNDTMPDWSCERAFFPDDLDAFTRAREPLQTVEQGRPVSDFDAIGVSVAYELEIFGLVKVLELAGMRPLAKDRRPADPPVILGGPLTFSNPLPAAPFADVVLLGECEELLPRVLAVFGSHKKRDALEVVATWPHVLVPQIQSQQIHGETLPAVAACENALLPAVSAIRTPHTELSDMLLVEAERGCHRNCTFCVMRRSTNGGMRLVTLERLLALVDASGAKKVGLVGAAVSDHPKIVEILRALVDDRGLRVGISSLRADRLTDDFVRLLGKGGYKTLTVASDAASERLRLVLEKKIKEKHLVRAAELAKTHGLKTLKTYMMLGVPGEDASDIDELARFTRELSQIMPVALGVAPFVPKYNTPLADADFAGEDEVDARVRQLRASLKGRGELRATSVKEAFVEAALAMSGYAAAEIVLASQSDGFGWKSFYRHIKRHGAPPRRRQHFVDPFPVGRRLLAKSVAA